MYRCHYFIKKNVIFLAIISISLFFITSLHPTFISDEAFTFSLIHHNISKIITLDSLDVHPPLYYILLKLFLIITTFWTKSIFIKVIFARLFSICIFILIVISFKRILEEINVNISNKYLILISLIYNLFPGYLFNVIKIRMYELSSLFLILEVLYIIKYLFSNKNKYLMLSTLFIILSSYTFYFAALSSLIYLGILWMYFLYKRRYSSLTKVSLSVLFFVVCYIPWLPILIKQMAYHSKNDNNTVNSSFAQILIDIVNGLTQWVTPFDIVLLMFWAFLIIFSLKHLAGYFNILLIITLINAGLTLIISLFICGTKFQSDTMFPISVIYVFLISYIWVRTLFYFKFNSVNKIYKCLLILIISLSVYSLGETCKNVRNYDIPTIKLINNVYDWEKTHRIYISVNSDSSDASQDAVYLSSINKKAILKKTNYQKLSKDLVNNSKGTKLTKNVFNFKVSKN